MGLNSLNDLDGVRPANREERVCASLVPPAVAAEDVLDEMVGAEDLRRPTKLWLVGGFFEEMGTIVGFVPRLIDCGEPRVVRSLVVAYND